MYIPFFPVVWVCYHSLKVTSLFFILDWTIDSETELTPLENGLALLEKLREECLIKVEIMEELKRRIKEAVRMTVSSPVDTNFSGDDGHSF